MKKLFIAVTVFVCCLGSPLAGSARAATITFAHSGSSGAGSLNGLPFTDKAFTITAIGDTNSVQPFGGPEDLFINHTSAAISIADVGTFNFITATRTFINGTLDLVGFSRGFSSAGIGGSDLYDGPFNPVFDGWHMNVSIGPVFGALDGHLLQWTLSDVVTTGGVLIFDDSFTDVVFTALVAEATPAPAALPLFATGLGALGLLGWRRKRKVTATGV